MPTPFAGYEVVKATPNFLITCEDDAGARQRAHDIAAVAETDLARLNQLFSTHFEYGTSSPWGIWVVVLKDDPTSDWNGQNHGYETLESSQISDPDGLHTPDASAAVDIPARPAAVART